MSGAGYLARRPLRHALLLLVTAGVSAMAWFAGSPGTAAERLSLASAWLSFALLGAALCIGPLEVLRSGRPVINHLLRRDFGIWAGLTGLLHLGAGTAVVLQPAYFRTYITGPPEDPLPGLAGWIGTLSIVGGYVIGILFLMLLALSSNRSLRRLGAARWKRLQRSAVWVFLLTITHGVIFQVIEGRVRGWLAALLVVSAAILILRWRARRAVVAAAG